MDNKINKKLIEFLLISMDYKQTMDKKGVLGYIISLVILNLETLETIKLVDEIPAGLMDLEPELVRAGAEPNGIYNYSLNFKEIQKDHKINTICYIDDIDKLKEAINNNSSLYFTAIAGDTIDSIKNIMIIPSLDIRHHKELITALYSINSSINSLN